MTWYKIVSRFLQIQLVNMLRILYFKCQHKALSHILHVTRVKHTRAVHLGGAQSMIIEFRKHN